MSFYHMRADGFMAIVQKYQLNSIFYLLLFPRRNAAAGGTHFGTWYRMHTHPEGQGFDPNICPQAVPLGDYSDNTAHSLGWFGLWVFETYEPKEDGSCSPSAPHKVRTYFF